MFPELPGYTELKQEATYGRKLYLRPVCSPDTLQVTWAKKVQPESEDGVSIIS